MYGGLAPEPCPLPECQLSGDPWPSPRGMAAGDEPLSRPCRDPAGSRKACSSLWPLAL